jgi:hypothetical protein
LKKFVCVRLIQAWGIDLTRFRFDCGQSWAAFTLKHDGTIYCRYGARSAPDASLHNTLEGFKKALVASLKLHEDFPKNKAELQGKKTPPPRWRTPEVIPENKGHHKRLVDNRKGCLCCHCVQSGEILSMRNTGMVVDDRQLWVFPLPDLLGFSLDRRELAVVSAVSPGSEAEKAGFQRGDRIRKMKGQLILSIADVTWVLHVAKAPAKIRTEVERDSKTVKLTLELPKQWRRRAPFHWRRATWPLRQRILGIVTEEVPEGERGGLGLTSGTLALRIKNVTPARVQKSNPSARKLGLKPGDVIVEVDGSRKPMNESELLAYAIQKRRPGQRVLLTILRGGREKRYPLIVQ